MRKIDVNVQFLHPVWEENDLKYATEHSAGLDLRACLDRITSYNVCYTKLLRGPKPDFVGQRK